jgi:formin-binding protein 1
MVGITGMLDGMNVRILEPDDGSGWVKVADQDGNSGLVPASYIQTAQAGSADSNTNSGERGTLSANDFPVLQHVHHYH